MTLQSMPIAETIIARRANPDLIEPLRQVIVRLPESSVRQLDALGSRMGLSRPELIRRLVQDASGLPMGRKKAVLLYEVPKATVTDETVKGLWQRGFTANQIAARLRKPYRTVLNEIYGEGQIREDPDT